LLHLFLLRILFTEDCIPIPSIFPCKPIDAYITKYYRINSRTLCDLGSSRELGILGVVALSECLGSLGFLETHVALFVAPAPAAQGQHLVRITEDPGWSGGKEVQKREAIKFAL